MPGNPDKVSELFLRHVSQSFSAFFDVMAEDFGVKFSDKMWLMIHFNLNMENGGMSDKAKVRLLGPLKKGQFLKVIPNEKYSA